MTNHPKIERFFELFQIDRNFDIYNVIKLGLMTYAADNPLEFNEKKADCFKIINRTPTTTGIIQPPAKNNGFMPLQKKNIGVPSTVLSPKNRVSIGLVAPTIQKR